jgi:hypothetical protein
VAARRVDLRDERHVGARVVRLDRRPHARAAGTDDQDVVRRFHYLRTLHNAAERAIGLRAFLLATPSLLPSVLA